MAPGQWDPSIYDRAWTAIAESGSDPHGEVAFLERLWLRRRAVIALVLDGGCGTGRVAIELARRGVNAEGTDLDAAMLSHAATKAPTIAWHLGNLASIELGASYDTIVMAGNVILFADDHDRSAVIANVARHLTDGGLLVAGFQLKRLDRRRVSLSEWDEWTTASGLGLIERFATWDDDPWTADCDYAVSVHSKIAT